MNPLNNFNKYKKFRTTYPNFVFENYSISQKNSTINIKYSFNCSDQFFFYPEITIPVRSFYEPESGNKEILENIAFHIGMIELVSYWKATCSPRLIIKPHRINDEQASWWKHLYFKGLGEFFYMNSIQADIDDFVEITSEGKELNTFSLQNIDNGYIVPIGGGKDSIVTLEMLRKNHDILPMIINPRKASLGAITQAGFNADNIAVVNRSIYKQLLKMNEQGFLNGHTPFSALLAFVSLLIASLSGKKHIALSNEESANEPTVIGTDVNHQYSKSFEFEKSFRDYVYQYISEKFWNCLKVWSMNLSTKSLVSEKQERKNESDFFNLLKDQQDN